MAGRRGGVLERSGGPALVWLALAALGAGLGSAPARAQVLQIREATAASPAGIQPTLDQFRADLGDPVNGNARGSQGVGRREITWDAGDNDSAPARMPGDFFNLIAPRGIEFPGQSNLQMSADTVNATATAIEFGNVNATYPTAFQPFSAPRLFVPLASNRLDASFRVPGTDQPAGVSGFGAVFTDVDGPGAARIDFFGQEGLLLSRDVLVTPGDASLSFLGASFDRPIVRVRITLGPSAVGPNDVTQTASNPDIVALDDFVYGEPVPVADVRVRDRVLEIFGGPEPDAIRATQSKKRATVKLNGASWAFPAGSFDQIHVRGNAGDDEVRVKALLPVAIDGGAGDDRLFGAKVRQLLLGGAGADEIRGGSQDDLLAAGSLIATQGLLRDELRAILEVWASDADYATRLDALRDGSLAPAFAAGVLEDVDPSDELKGAKGDDWFLGADPAEALDLQDAESFDTL